MITLQGLHSALDPAGPQAAAIRQLWRVMLVLATGVYVVVTGMLLLIAWRRRRQPNDSDGGGREATARRAVMIAVGITVAILFPLLLYDFTIARVVSDRPPGSLLAIRVTGRQWWWEIEYEDSVAQQRVRLANEIHIPVGRPVLLELSSHDVIHSFWAPNIGGKRDLIPGHPTEQWIRADRPGTYRVQCAEYCGIQHANMAMFVVVEAPDRFAAWLDHQRAPAAAATDSLAARGRELVETGSCGTCHAVASTRAAGRTGPDLTHVASRLTLAAGTLENGPGHLAGWIADPQTAKPGALMPTQALSSADLRALVAYLSALR